jgi:gamma-glutamyltranspeptidase/glutathione hydrolase
LRENNFKLISALTFLFHAAVIILLPQSIFAATENNHQFMVVTEQKDATRAGVEILKAGGNAIDAAVAIGYALAVSYPAAGNIGGGGFMLIHLADGRNVFLNFREKAPSHASKKMYLDKNGEVNQNKSINGYLAVAVPGTVLGLDTALKQYGTMTRQQVMAPAIQLAVNGYLVTPYAYKVLLKFLPYFKSQPNIADIFLKNGMPYPAGSKIIQKDLAHTLQLISQQGPDVFYKGQIAKDVVSASEHHGGILTLNDFANYNVEQLKPVKCEYRGYTILSAPPPSSGGTVLCEMLNILENFPLSEMGYQNAASTRSVIEAMRYGFYDRNKYLGDPDFINNPLQRLLSKSYAKIISDQIKLNQRAPDASRISVFKEWNDTTHYSVVDGFGNAVSVTYTLNGSFGAKVIAGNTGFFLNDEMDDFSVKPGDSNQFGLVQGDANEIAPNKRPLSSMTPTIVLKKNKVYLVLGSPGGPRIISSVLLTLLNVIDYGMTIQQAVNAPRFHYQVMPDLIYTEPLAFPFSTRQLLIHKNYHLMPQGYWSAVEAIEIDPVTGEIHGANDIRRPDGEALGNVNQVGLHVKSTQPTR